VRHLKPSLATADDAAAVRLPAPPKDDEVYGYFGPQHRWLQIMRAVGACSVAVNLWLFAVGQPVLVPFTLVASVVLVTNAINVWTSTRKRLSSVSRHTSLIATWNPMRPPTVDVFLPTAGEPLAMLTNTMAYIANMQYRGRMQVYVLDDSGRRSVAALTARFGFNYISRPNAGELKKAGNLRYGFARSDGELIVIFDADFVPRTDFLRHVTPYFADPSVGVVQTPQYFDTDRRLGWLESGAGATQELFYRWIQPSRDALGVPICCGTNAVYRRSALACIGGIPAIDHSEDMYTGFELMKADYAIRYVPVVLAKGLCPDELESFVAQQYRWCMGSMCLLLDPTFHRARMTTAQRLAFYSGLGYYITTAVFVFVMPLPTLIMTWFLPQFISPLHYLWLVPAIAAYPVTAALHRSNWGFNALRVQLIYCFAHAVAIVHALGKRSAEWVPTGQRTQRRTVAKTIVELTFYWLASASLVLVVGLGLAAARGISPMALLVTTGIAVCGLMISVPVMRLAWRAMRDDQGVRSTDASADEPAALVPIPTPRAASDPPTVRLQVVGAGAPAGGRVPAMQARR
jgi:cellulose synthase (UDP-forming)